MITDILVIGSGISGLTYAIKIGEQNPELQLTIISKNNLFREQHPLMSRGNSCSFQFQKDSMTNTSKIL